MLAAIIIAFILGANVGIVAWTCFLGAMRRESEQCEK
jgi:hypothetical protein